MGYGDDIMATAEAKEAKKLFPDANILIGDGRFNYPSIMYLNNPYISEIKNMCTIEKLFPNALDIKIKYVYHLQKLKNERN